MSSPVEREQIPNCARQRAPVHATCWLKSNVPQRKTYPPQSLRVIKSVDDEWAGIEGCGWRCGEGMAKKTFKARSHKKQCHVTHVRRGKSNTTIATEGGREHSLSPKTFATDANHAQQTRKLYSALQRVTERELLMRLNKTVNDLQEDLTSDDGFENVACPKS